MSIGWKQRSDFSRTLLAPNLSATTPAVAAPARAWAASFFPSFQDICYDFKGILKQKTPHFIRLYKGFVGFSGSTEVGIQTRTFSPCVPRRTVSYCWQWLSSDIAAGRSVRKTSYIYAR